MIIKIVANIVNGFFFATITYRYCSCHYLVWVCYVNIVSRGSTTSLIWPPGGEPPLNAKHTTLSTAPKRLRFWYIALYANSSFSYLHKSSKMQLTSAHTHMKPTATWKPRWHYPHIALARFLHNFFLKVYRWHLQVQKCRKFTKCNTFNKYALYDV